MSLVNKVAASGLISLNLEDFLPREDIMVFDLKDHLFMGLILKEKDFREALKSMDWSVYQEKYVTVHCSADAIIPVWAYMLVTTYLEPVAKDVYVGTREEYKKHLFLKNLSNIDPLNYQGQKIVIKGCGEAEVGEFAYAEITRKLRPVVQSLMYGEPCSTVPIYKKR